MIISSKIGVGLNEDNRWELLFVGFDNYIYQTWLINTSTSEWHYTAARGDKAKSLVVGKNAAKCLEMIYIGIDNKLYRVWQSGPNQPLTNFQRFTQNIEAKVLALGIHAGNRLELFYIDANNDLYHTWQENGEWKPESPFFATKAKTIAVAPRDAGGLLQIFYADENNDVYYRHQQVNPDSWDAAIPFGLQAKSIVVGRPSDDLLVVFYTLLDDTLCYRLQAGDSGGWTPQSSFNHKVSQVAVGNNYENDLEVFYLDIEGKIYHMKEAPSRTWSPAALFASGATSLTVGKRSNGWLELFYIRDDGLFHNVQTAANTWTGEHPLHIDEPWFVTGHQIFDPGTGMHINDHCFFYSTKDGRWHLFGIEANNIGHPAPSGVPGHFVHATAERLTQRCWQRQQNALEQVTASESQLWAPHVVERNGTYYMFYCSGSIPPDKPVQYRLSLATSTDLQQWTRHPNPLFEDGFQARDPMVMWNHAEQKWVMYYTATENPAVDSSYIVACRTSTDLLTWGPRKIAFKDTKTGQYFGPTESPYVLRRGDYYYLFIGPRPYGPTTAVLQSWVNWRDAGYDGTEVFRSRRWDLWSLGDKIGHIPAHAAEIVQDLNGDWYVSHAGLFRGGVYLLPFHWRDGLG